MDSAVVGLQKKVLTQIYRTGTGSVSTVSTASGASASASNFYLPLANTLDINSFEIGDVVVASAADGGSLRSGSATVTGLDLNTGSLVTTTTWSTAITSLTTGDYIYRCSADASNGGAAQVLQGYLAWSPASTAALTVSFFSVTRSVNQGKLAGVFYDNSTTGSSYTEALLQTAKQVQSNGARKKLKLIIMHPDDRTVLESENSTKILYNKGGDSAMKAGDLQIGFGEAALMTSWGPVIIKTSIFAVAKLAMFVSPETWTYRKLRQTRYNR